MSDERRLIVLAPARPQADLAQRIAALLARADHWPQSGSASGRLYDDLFVVRPAVASEAALTRQLDVGDAGDMHWLRADPSNLRAEMANVRLMACGDLDVTPDEAQALVAALAPVFGDEGFELSAPVPNRWYLRAFAFNAVPDFPVMPGPDQSLGRDIFELWPEDAIGKRWRRLFSEAQIVLNQHPVNRTRVQAHKPAINGLWFHGAGRHPTQVVSGLAGALTDDPVLLALARASGVQQIDALPAVIVGAVLVDLRADADGLTGVLRAWDDGAVNVLEWRSPGGRWLRKPWHRWRFWRG